MQEGRIESGAGCLVLARLCRCLLCLNSDKNQSRFLCKCQRDIEGLEPANLNPKRIPFGPKGGLELGDSNGEKLWQNDGFLRSYIAINGCKTHTVQIFLFRLNAVGFFVFFTRDPFPSSPTNVTDIRPA